MIKPALNELVQRLKARGHDAEVRTQDRDERTKPVPVPSIVLRVFPSGIERARFDSTSTPKISFNADTRAETVYTHVSTMMPGRGGSSGIGTSGIRLSDITSASVQQQALAFLKQIF